VDCDHRWRRLPLYDLWSTYVCDRCGLSDRTDTAMFPPPGYADLVIPRVHGGQMAKEED
jgi:hypothetical protein